MTIPDRLTFKRKEVTRLTKLDGKVLDFWEQEFGGFKIMTNKMGEQFYSRQDVETILKIKQLLIVDRKSKAKVKEIIATSMEENGLNPDNPPKAPSNNSIEEKFKKIPAEKLKIIRKNLQEILTILEKNDIY